MRAADHLEDGGISVAEAFAAWAKTFEERAQRCQKIAEVLSGHKVSAMADGVFLFLEGENKKADKALETLIKAKLLDLADDDENEDDE